MNISSLKSWVEAMRLRTIPVSIAGVLAGMAFGIIGGGSLSWVSWVCIAFAILCQIASNFANEYFDFKAGRDAPGREGPRRGVTEGDISPRMMLWATLLLSVLASLCGLSLVFRGGWWMILVGVVVLVGLFAYSAGPYPLSTHGLGEVAVVVFFGVVPVVFTSFLESLNFSLLSLFGGIAIGLLGANVLIVNNLRDIPDDSRVGKRTLAVRFGRPSMIRLYAFNCCLAGILLLPGFYAVIGLFSLISVGICFIFGFLAASHLKFLEGRDLNPWLGRSALFMFFVALSFFLLTVIF